MPSKLGIALRHKLQDAARGFWQGAWASRVRA